MSDDYTSRAPYCAECGIPIFDDTHDRGDEIVCGNCCDPCNRDPWQVLVGELMERSSSPVLADLEDLDVVDLSPFDLRALSSGERLVAKWGGWLRTIQTEAGFVDDDYRDTLADALIMLAGKVQP